MKFNILAADDLDDDEQLAVNVALLKEMLTLKWNQLCRTLPAMTCTRYLSCLNPLQTRQRPIPVRLIRVKSIRDGTGATRAYDSSDGHQKATLEEAFGSRESLKKHAATAPWELGWQVSERNMKWMNTFREKLVKNFAAEELKLSEQEFDQKLQILMDLLPGISERIVRMPPPVIAELLRRTPSLAKTLLRLKEIFPEADVSALVIARPDLASMPSLDTIAKAAEELRALLPNSRVDLLIEHYPALLDLDQVREAMQLMETLMPDSDFEEVLRKNPSMIFSLQTGRNMIPYDEVPTSNS